MAHLLKEFDAEGAGGGDAVFHYLDWLVWGIRVVWYGKGVGGEMYDPGELPLKIYHEISSRPHVQNQVQNILRYDQKPLPVRGIALRNDSLQKE